MRARQQRLTRATDFKRVRRTGKSYAHPLLVLIAAANDHPFSRVGVTTSRSFRTAVARNRARRRLRHAVHPRMVEISPGWDLVFIARPALIDAEWKRLEEAIMTLLAQAGVREESQ